MQVTVIIPAAGSSNRFNASDSDSSAILSTNRSKLDEDLGGKTVLQRTIELFNTRPEVHQVLVAGPFGDQPFSDFTDRHGDRISLLGAKLVRGGEHHRYETVQSALAHVDELTTHVAVHDGARPATKQELIDRVFDAAKVHGAVIPGVPVADTLKRVDDEPIENDHALDPVASILGGESAPKMYKVLDTIDRTNTMAIQTPQIFERKLLVRAYEQSDLASTDDAGLIERLGEQVVVVQGDSTNMKLTYAHELPLLRAIMKVSSSSSRPSHKRF
jgi:2-C-methyl-D-erythritol 4-phosphate cytidylyltransferase